jgi:putative transcriptional regulator
MAERQMSVKELAKKMGMNRVSISKLRLTPTYPRISGDTLNTLCHYLSCTPCDLIEYIPDSNLES